MIPYDLPVVYPIDADRDDYTDDPFARQGVEKSGVAGLAVTSRDSLDGRASFVLAGIARARVADDAGVDSDWRLSRSSVERRSSRRSVWTR